MTPSGNPRDLNFSRTVAGITKWLLVTTEGYLSYLLPKFEDLIPTILADITIKNRRKSVTLTADYCIHLCSIPEQIILVRSTIE